MTLELLTTIMRLHSTGQKISSSSEYRMTHTNYTYRHTHTKQCLLFSPCSGCPGWPFSSSDQANSDGWFKHDCIDLSACLESFEEQAPRGHVITRVWFDYRNDFWIDELMVVVGQFDGKSCGCVI